MNSSQNPVVEPVAGRRHGPNGDAHHNAADGHPAVPAVVLLQADEAAFRLLRTEFFNAGFEWNFIRAANPTDIPALVIGNHIRAILTTPEDLRLITPDLIRIAPRLAAIPVVPMLKSADDETDDGDDNARFFSQDWHCGGLFDGMFHGAGKNRFDQRLAESHSFSENVYHSLVDNLPHNVFRKDREGRITFANQIYCDSMDMPLEELLGKTDLDLYPEEHAHRYQQDDEMVMEFLTPIDSTTQYQAPDGRKLVVRIIKQPLLDSDGKCIGLQGVFWDVTRERRAEEALMEQARLLDLASDSIIVRDSKGYITFWNQGAEKLYGWTKNEALGELRQELLRDSMAKIEKAERILKARGSWAGELRQHDRDGGEVIVNSRWTLVKDGTGELKAVLEISTDISEQKRLESQFLRVQRMEGIGTLASGLAHDLNNILAPITMSVPLLQEFVTNPDLKEVINTIESSASRGASIIRQLLTFGRGVEGEKVQVQVKHLIRDVVKIANETFPKNISTRFQPPHELWSIIGDATQIHQVLLNLAVNARDAMPDGGELVFEAEAVVLDEHYAAMNVKAKAAPYIRIRATDSGTGIPEHVREKIFDPFFTTKELGKGTGLGLSTVVGIVKSHGGFMEVESQVGHGTVFTIHLPAVVESDENASEVRKDSALPTGKGETILVIDDEESILVSTERMLERCGYKVLIAHDGAEALAVYGRNMDKIDLVLTDVVMPVMGAAEMVPVMKRMNPQIRIMASTGLSTTEQVASLKDHGVRTILAKPYTARTLLTTVHQILSGAEGPETSPPERLP